MNGENIVSLRTGAIVRVVGWSAAVFYRLECRGGPIPAGPVLVVANHPNALLDPLLVFRTAGRPTRPLAKAPLFSHPLIGPVLRGLGGLPVFRKQEDPSMMHRNEETFARAIEALRVGEAVQIYPEGKSHPEPGLAPLRTGAARIALRAEAESGWTLGLRIVPVGLTYDRRETFRARALAVIGEPFTLTDLREAHGVDPVEAVRRLTERIEERLGKLIPNVSSQRDLELIETAERMYSRQKGEAGWREREPLAKRFPRLQAFAEGLTYLREFEPERHARLCRAVRRYGRRATVLGAADADVPRRIPASSAARYALRESSWLGLRAPVAALGAAAWYLPYLLPRLVVSRMRLEPDVVATYKLVVGLFALLAAYAGWIIVAGLLLGWLAAVAVAALLPVLGAVALAWRDRWQGVREDGILYWRMLSRPRSAGRLAERRSALVEEFDHVAEQVSAVGKRPPRL